MKFCLLSSINYPMLANYIAELRSNDVPIDCVLLDSKLSSEKDLRIFEERTGGSWKFQDLYGPNSHNIPFFFVDRHGSDLSKQIIEKREIDFCVNAGTPRILKSDFLEVPKYGVLNVHPGILPFYRGACAVEWSIFNDDPIGNTVHLMSAGIDEGPIFKTGIVNCDYEDRYPEIRTKVYQSGLSLLAEVLKDLNTGKISLSDAVAQEIGKYYKPMSDLDHQEVLRKLNESKYKYQTVKDKLEGKYE